MNNQKKILQEFQDKFRRLHIMSNGTVDMEYIDLRLFLLSSLDQVRKEGFEEGQRRQAKFRTWYQKGFGDGRKQREALTKLKGVREDEEIKNDKGYE